MKRTVIAATALALVGTLSSCGGDDQPKADPTPTESAPPSDSTSPSATATPEPTWDDKFTPAQISRYRAASERWLEYWGFLNEAQRKGVDTVGVKAGFEEYSMNPLGDHSKFLDLYVRGGARTEVAPEVRWTSASKIRQTTVVFNYCLDYTDARITVNGTANPVEPPYRRLVTVQMRRTVKGWMKEIVIDTPGVKTCDPTAP